MKICSKCKIEKLKSEFFVDSSRKDKLNYSCKLCVSSCNKAREKIKNYSQKRKEWKKKNWEYYSIQQTQYDKNKRKNDPLYRLRKNLRARLVSFLKSKTNFKSSGLTSLLSCTATELKQHLESKFQSDMNWNNYGIKGWHIDHILPLSNFDLSNPEQLAKACHYTNLQPLWWIDNLKKSNHINL